MVSRQALENWLAKPFVQPEEHKSRSQSVSGDAELQVCDILCTHGALHPHKASSMKRISRVSANPRCSL